MMIQAKLESLKGIKLHEWAVRFFFGGVVCVLAGLVAKRFGPGIGGLFLAFPAIFPAGASMVEAHEKKHKARVGLDGTNRGRTVAAIDAAGAMLGCIGLAGFAATCWLCLPQPGHARGFCPGNIGLGGSGHGRMAAAQGPHLPAYARRAGPATRIPQFLRARFVISCQAWA